MPKINLGKVVPTINNKVPQNGTLTIKAEDIPFDENTSVKEQINSLDAEKADKTEVNYLATDLNQTNNNVNATNLRIDNLVIPISAENTNIEVTDAHNSIVKNKNFASLKDRLEESEQDLAEHKSAYAQLEGVNDGAVTPDKSSYFIPTPSKNLFTSDWEIGGITGSTGEENTNTNFMRTDDYISVASNEKYTVTLTGLSIGVLGYIYEFDANKSILSYFSYDASKHKVFITSPTTTFLRFGTYRYTAPVGTNILPSTSQLELGGVSTDYVSSKPSSFHFDTNFIDVLSTYKKLNLIGANVNMQLNSPLLIPNRNLFQTSWENGKISGENGELVTSTQFGRTVDFLEISPLTRYTLSYKFPIIPSGIYAYFYDASKSYLTYTAAYDTEVMGFITPTDAVYIKFGIWFKEGAAGIFPTQSQFELGSQSDYIAPDVVIDRKYISTPNILEQTQWENEYVKQIAHRGYSSIAPENTAPAYILARQKGFKYVEGDIWFTVDGVPVLNHLRHVDSQSNGTGNVEELTLEYLQTLDFGSWKDPEYAGTPILTYEDFLILCKKLGLYPYMDLKSVITPERASILVNLAKKLGMLRKITWLGGFVSLDNIRLLDSKARIGTVSYDAPINYDLSQWVSRITEEGNVFLDLDYSAITQELSDICTENGVGLEAWIVNDEETLLNLVEMNVQGITTDGLAVGKILMDSVIEQDN